MVTLLSYLIQFCCILLFFTVILLFFTYSFLYLLCAVKHFGTPKWIVVKGCINKLHLHLSITEAVHITGLSCTSEKWSISPVLVWWVVSNLVSVHKIPLGWSFPVNTCSSWLLHTSEGRVEYGTKDWKVKHKGRHRDTDVYLALCWRDWYLDIWNKTWLSPSAMMTLQLRRYKTRQHIQQWDPHDVNDSFTSRLRPE